MMTRPRDARKKIRSTMGDVYDVLDREGLNLQLNPTFKEALSETVRVLARVIEQINDRVIEDSAWVPPDAQAGWGMTEGMGAPPPLPSFCDGAGSSAV